MKGLNTKTDEKDGFRIFWLLPYEVVAYGLMFTLSVFGGAQGAIAGLLMVGIPFLVAIIFAGAKHMETEYRPIPATVAEEFAPFKKPKTQKQATPKKQKQPGLILAT